MEVRGPLEIAGIERLAADPTTNLFTGRIYWNTTSQVLRLYSGGIWSTVGIPTQSNTTVKYEASIDSDLDLSGTTADTIKFGYLLFPSTDPNDLARTITTPLVASTEFDQVTIKFHSNYYSDLTLQTPDGKLFRKPDGTTAATITIRSQEFVQVFYDPASGSGEWVITDSSEDDIPKLSSIRKISANLDLTDYYITNAVTNKVSRFDIPVTVVNESGASGTVLTLFDGTSTDPFILAKQITIKNPTDYTMDVTAFTAQTILNKFTGTSQLTWTLAANTELVLVKGASQYEIVSSTDPAIAPVAAALDDLSDVNVPTPEEGQALVYESGTWIAGASGDASFKLQSIVGQDLTVKSGNIILNSGLELRTAAGADLTVDLSGYPDDTYYFYINLSTIPAPAAVAGREVSDVANTDIVALTTLPYDVDSSTYLVIGGATKATTWSNLFTSAFRRHDLAPIGQPDKNYIANSDAAISTANSSSTANVTIARTTTAANLPEESKRTAWQITASGAATDGTDYAEFSSKWLWDDADSRRVCSALLKAKATGGWKFYAYNVTDSAIAGQTSDEMLFDDEYALDVYPAAAKDIRIRLVPTTANPPAIYASSITLTPESPVYGATGGYKVYDHGTDLTMTISGGTNPVVNWGYVTAEKDPINNVWYISGRAYLSRDNAATTSFTLTIPGITWTNTRENVIGWLQDAGVADREWLLGRTAGSGDISIAPVSGQTFDTALISFNRIRLDSKPTWADFDGTLPTLTEQQKQNAKIKLTRTGSDQSLTNGAYTDLVWNGTSYNIGGSFTHSGSSADIVIEESGYYRILVQGSVLGTVSGANTGFELWKSDNSLRYTFDKIIQRTTAPVRTEYEDYFEAGTSIKLRCFVSDAGLSFRQEGSSFTIHRISENTGRTAGLPFSDYANSTSDQYLLRKIRKQSLPSFDLNGYGTSDLKITKVDDIVTITFLTDSSATAASATSIDAIPTWARPTVKRNFMVANGNGRATFFMCSVNTDGTMLIYTTDQAGGAPLLTFKSTSISYHVS